MNKLFKNRVFQHVCFWLFYIAIYTFNYAQNGNYLPNFYATLLYMPGHMVFVYTQLYVLVPRFVMKQKLVMYILTTAVLLKLIIIYNALVIYPFTHPLLY